VSVHHRQHGDGRNGEEDTSDAGQFRTAENRQYYPQGMYVDSAAYEPRKDHVVLYEPQCAEKNEHCDGLVDRMKAHDERCAYRRYY